MPSMCFLCAAMTRPVGVWLTDGVYAPGQVSLHHVFAASQLCRQAMHHGPAAGIAATPLSQHTSKLHTQLCQTQVTAVQHWLFGLQNFEVS